MHRRAFIGGLTGWFAGARLGLAIASVGQRLAAAARAQVGVTTGYDPTYTAIPYPGGDVSRSTGVCADVVIRAARDGLAIDLQKLVHEDMMKHFDEYPARKTWGSKRPDASIDHRRVLNLEAYFTRSDARLWAADGAVAGDAFPLPLQAGDIVTWLLDARLPHIGIIVSTTAANPDAHVVHNIGRGAEESALVEFRPHRAQALYRWPVRG
ncbi:MAG TPA: DUF1287 domain-containing protein [Terracidiphilus sp.]|nr:DUF1287 domain-containing protein [Terracidiphilus sp.]